MVIRSKLYNPLSGSLQAQAMGGGGQSQVPALRAKNVHHSVPASSEDYRVNVRSLAPNWLDPHSVNVIFWDPVLSEKPDFSSSTETGDAV